ncbi:hypothetical protein [Granulicella tundricola]|uniref:Uncharacterized protein n=1 Tax=Granulicella tundricola (strain ATCC BAA-1859 / DSM 23138 / MP5ACTX9) TaxID=1198114 RepID=E8WY97_GRATM|nr:hypothetical protein [Granulicella tundricola]ADW68724.1 hypothetical protein AciX9_1674 [Granulicella tundricola MP5ACTX9]
MSSSIDPSTFPNATTAADSITATSSPRRLLHYCLTVVLIPILAIPAFIQLGRSNFFLHHGASVWVRSNDAIFDIHDRDCDVLVYGDSTAMTGIDPEVVENHTGFRTCNIAVTNAVLAVTNNLTLNHYLAQNGKPRVLLVQLSPDDFQSENHAWHQTIYAEGLLELLRHGTPQQARDVLLSHPQESIAFAGYAIGFTAWYAIKDAWFHTTHLRPDEDSVTVRNGFFTPPSPARKSCEPAMSLISNDPAQAAFSRNLVADYREGYARNAGVVLVNVAPIPSCDENLAAYSAQLDGVTSNSLLPLPIGLFNDGRHYTARGSEVVSTLIAGELNTVANRNPSIDDRVPPTHMVAFLRRVHLRLHRTPRKSTPKFSSPGYDVLIFPPDVAPFEITPTLPSEDGTLSIPGLI